MYDIITKIKPPQREGITVELSDKLQQLRKEKGLTQEELASALYVSRTAISKWESGRGTPGIDSLKEIARFFSVSIDDLLSAEKALTLAKEENRQTQSRFRDLVLGLLDLSTGLFFVLPLFGQKLAEGVREVSLLSLTAVAPYMKTAYIALVVVMMSWGVLALALQTCTARGWAAIKHPGSLLLNLAGVALFILSPQPYAALFLLVIFLIKGLILIKKP